jgi:hypothetical protein
VEPEGIMSFYLRQTVKAGSFRVRLSGSGIGVSTRVPGLRSRHYVNVVVAGKRDAPVAGHGSRRTHLQALQQADQPQQPYDKEGENTRARGAPPTRRDSRAAVHDRLSENQP